MSLLELLALHILLGFLSNIVVLAAVALFAYASWASRR